MNFGVRMLLILVITAAIFVVPSMAVLTQDVQVPLQDTYYPSAVNGCNPATIGNQSVVHGNETVVYLTCFDPSEGWKGIFQYNLSRVLNHIIAAGNWTVTLSSGSGASGQSYSLSYSANNTWNENTVVPGISTISNVLLSPLGITASQPAGTVFTAAVDVNSPIAMGLLYNNSGDLVSFQTDEQISENTIHQIYSKENTTAMPATFSFLSADTSANFINAVYSSCGPIICPTFYYDFDSQIGSFSDFPQADFSYQLNTNTITPIHGATMALVSPPSQNPNNDLLDLNCFVGRTYTTGGVGSLNIPLGNFSQLCFNLSAQHNGRDFLGAIKVVNNTVAGLVFNAQAEEYAPSFAALSSPTASPFPLVPGQNATISWTSTVPVSSGMYYFFDLFGVTSPVVTASDPALSTSHSLDIPGDSIFANAIYFVSLFGVDQNNNLFTTPYFNFSASSTSPPPPQLPYINGSCQIWVLPFTSQGFPTAAYVSFDGLAAIHTNQYSSNTTTVGYVNAAGFTSLGGVTSCFGLHNISAFYPGSESVNVTVDVQSTPFFVNIKFGVANTCVKLSETNDNVTATTNLLNAINSPSNPYNVTGYYVAYNASTDTWQGFGCLDGYFPASLAQFFNSTVPIGSSSSNVPGVSNVVPAFANPIAAALGITPDQVLNMLSLIISIIVMGVVGFYTKNGLVSALVFLGMIVLFSLIGWLPIWIMVILVVIAALLISRYGRNMFMTGGE